jgi:HSP20 family protein
MAKSSNKPSMSEEECTGGIDTQSFMQFFLDEFQSARNPSGAEPVNHVPYLDLYSTKTQVTIEVEIPGVRADDIDISVFKSTVKIKAVKYECFDDNNVNYVCMERSFGTILRSVEIPVPVNTGKVKAKYINGMLSITLPRIEEKRGQPKKIKIETK